jgi:hypothetical protein
MLMASAALADAPSSLMKGNWSLAYTAGSGAALSVGYGLKDMNKVVIDFGVSNTDLDPAEDDAFDPDSATEFQIGAAYHYYLMKMSNQYFSPFIGGRFGYADAGGDTDGDFEFDFRFGGEAFPITPLSIGGYVAFGYSQDNDAFYDSGENSYYDANTLGTTRSAIFASLYW